MGMVIALGSGYIGEDAQEALCARLSGVSSVVRPVEGSDQDPASWISPWQYDGYDVSGDLTAYEERILEVCWAMGITRVPV